MCVCALLSRYKTRCLMMMTLGTAATWISSTSKHRAQTDGDRRWANARLTPINLPTMSNVSPLSQSFLLRAEAQLILKLRSLRSATAARRAPLTKRMLAANWKRTGWDAAPSFLAVIVQAKPAMDAFVWNCNCENPLQAANDINLFLSFFLQTFDKFFQGAFLWSRSTPAKPSLMIRATIMMLTSSDLDVFGSVIQGRQLSSADVRLLYRGWKQSRESK